MTRRHLTAFARPALLLAAAACASTPGDGAARAGLLRLDEALRLRAEPQQWEQVAPVAGQAVAQLQPAAAAGEPGAATGLAAAQALVTWQAVCEAGWTLEGQAGWESARVAAAHALLGWLAATPNDVPAGWSVATLLRLETGDDAGAAAGLVAGLQRFPADAALNDLVRARRDSLPAPEALATQLDAAPQAARTETLTTQGHLLLAGGLQAEEAGDTERAIGLFERGGHTLAQVQSAPDQRLSDWTLRQRLADCMANAGRLRLAAGYAHIAEDDLPGAAPQLHAAEADWTAALAALPDDEESRAGAAATADAWFAGGDMAGARDAFGRLALRFDVAEWWNNTAFLARETGQYEESYAAYERCLLLEPDNANYLNDTALILLYHLDRDLERAEAQFRRAIERGREVCDNPFTDEDVHALNFTAFTDAMLNLSLLMARDGRLDEAAALCDELLEIAPDRPDAQRLRDDIAAARRGEPLKND